jgi:hypothetical protein
MAIMGSGPARVRALGLVGIIFLVGGLAGAATERILTGEVRPRSAPEEAQRRPWVVDEMDLTPDQRAAVHAILERRSERMKAAWDEIAPRLEAIGDSTKQEIKAVLAPAQRVEFDRRLEARRERDRQRDGRH